MVAEPTRYLSNSANILDIIITDSPGLLSNIEVSPPIANLDHCVITCSLALRHCIDKAFARKIWDYKNGNNEGLNLSLEAHMRRILFMDPMMDKNAADFSSVLLDCAAYFIPNRIIKIRPRDKPYITQACRKADRERDQAHRKYQRTRNPLHYDQFREKRRESKLVRQNAKITHHNWLMTKLSTHSVSSKDYWKTMKIVMGAKAKPGIGTLNVNGDQLVDSVEKATAFNRYFASQCTLNDVPSAMPPMSFETAERIGVVRTTPDEVETLTRALDSSKANGPDGISIQFLKSTATSISDALSRLFNTSFRRGIVPTQWKEANITPVYKKGDKQVVSNYRPISLLSVVGKLQERIVFKVLYRFLREQNLLTWRNSGFKPKDSAMNQLIMVTQKIYDALENGHDVNIAFLDISKAFDRVWHQALIHKLESMGVTGELLKWLSDYLENWKQRVVLESMVSYPGRSTT
jgi:hypothetical protein